ncbi:MAG: BamA/TamA family outer membrane protein [Myxococcota bacterium]|nr:BamA/TamA family outer membrane protein [Myxococcota bacterium]
MFCWLVGLLLQVALAEPSVTETPVNRFAAVPLVNFTTDRGVGYGVYGALFHLGPEGPGDAPYLAQVGAQLYQTTGGYQDHKLVVDLPRLAGGAVRADLQVGLEVWDGAFYFGQGNALPRLRPEATPEGFYTFGLESLRVVSKARIPVWGEAELFVGQLARSAGIAVYPGSRLDIEQPVGVSGGWLSQVQAGLLIDTRDHEFAATDGVFSEVSLRGSHPVLGSDWTMWGFNLTDRRYWSLGEKDLVLALREAVDLQRGEAPFFHQVVMGGSQWVDIGGPLAMRGLPIGRYRGEWTLYGDAELRWGVKDFSTRRSGFRVFLVSFVGGVRIVEPSEPDSGVHAHVGGGGGVRLLYNEVFLARLDLALGREEYSSVDDPLGKTVSERGWVPGVYLAFSAPY